MSDYAATIQRAVEDGQKAKDRAHKEAMGMGISALIDGYSEAIGMTAYTNRLYHDTISRPFLESMKALDDWEGLELRNLREMVERQEAEKFFKLFWPNAKRIIDGCIHAQTAMAAIKKKNIKEVAA